ncbi:hypothetical protein ACWFRQ_07195 [Streptomyces niveus]
MIFFKCTLRETTFTADDLDATLIDDCDLRPTEFLAHDGSDRLHHDQKAETAVGQPYRDRV